MNVKTLGNDLMQGVKLHQTGSNSLLCLAAFNSTKGLNNTEKTYVSGTLRMRKAARTVLSKVSTGIKWQITF